VLGVRLGRSVQVRVQHDLVDQPMVTNQMVTVSSLVPAATYLLIRSRFRRLENGNRTKRRP